jgi:hypothetical protein
MSTVCAWCGAGESAGEAGPEPSHGICPVCLDAALARRPAEPTRDLEAS